ncbi:MAG: hypothetical protein ACREMO_05345 [Gemmatimonadales bacterium]
MRTRTVVGGLAVLLGVGGLGLWLIPRSGDSPEYFATVFLSGELVRLATAQAQYYALHGRYSSSTDSLPDWSHRDYILVRIDSADATGWLATATWPTPPISCRWRVQSPAAPAPTFAEVARAYVVY